MASLVCIEDCIRHNDKWRVQRDNGSNYRIFDSFEEAQIYYDYLQTLDNQEKALSQNQKIIENQNRILEQNKGLRTAPRIQQVRQVLDPEYEEWLRYKKDTDPAYQKWKAEEERKKREKCIAEREKAIAREKEENTRYFNQKKRDISYHKERIDKFNKIFKRTSSLYSDILSISFVPSRKIDYYSKNEYWDSFFIDGGIPFRYCNESIKTAFDSLNKQLKDIPDLYVFINNLSQLASRGERCTFDNDLKKLSSIDNNFSCFYQSFAKGVKQIVDEYKNFSDPYFYSGYVQCRKPLGLSAKLKIKNAVHDYLRNNNKNYRRINDIYQELVVLLKSCDIPWWV